ncbi:DUF1254 domain-containing protein [Noviherbaspirillum saxi]|uniref:DUF1254 domain-containing protein n=1 Tax=Noviherbaspirillum saxi TaxID=2320863 RepID=A0A3A3G276_9BURK|nr:DUF1254 domain-containing protein [Noviherbaspirillum saxi]RJF95536.1 DUF1254 domain-containing protein [Noviherbaspirillum saxi]
MHTDTHAANAALLRDAILYTLPLYEMARMRAMTCPRRDAAGAFAGDSPDSALRWVNHFIHTRQLLGPQHRQVVTPNNDTLYTNAWLDLSEAPVLIHVPDSGDRYYVLGLLDFYSNPFAYIGTRTTGNAAGRYVLHGPSWTGELPEGATPIACPTNAVWIIGRIMTAGPEDLQAAHAFQDTFHLTALDGSAAHRRFDVGMQPKEQPADAARFVDVVAHALRTNPPPVQETALVARFAQLGIGPQASSSKLYASQLAALEGGIRAVLDEIGAPQPSALGGGWFLPVEVHQSYGDNYFARAQVARNYIGALGIEEAMYIMADCDGNGAPLDGRHAYELHFPPGQLPQVGAFWSVTLYDKADCMLVDNPLNRYSLGDRSPTLRAASDGGLSLYFGAQPPADADLHGNWVPAPAAPFYLTLRLYVPHAAHLNKTFVYPSITHLA